MLTYGVTRKRVRLAREKAGAPRLPRGRRRGSRAGRTAPRPAGELIADRIREQRTLRNRPAPTRSMLAQRVRALHEAMEDGDFFAIRDALVDLGAGCGLVLDHLQALEAA